ncbi:hypothetical protein NA56DRAFT_709151 [Hyaloscypha hepaticicola]|uniref:Uncharacterized protein n=1 Tax=Hyaloscypha hepaticicola TaxID=2082293 RepID=A0A2J6PPW5_9HELO|nr:hypothetical protein NA56DRAFT_709151 [Hyaloscypha hepaticicola]
MLQTLPIALIALTCVILLVGVAALLNVAMKKPDGIGASHSVSTQQLPTSLFMIKKTYQTTTSACGRHLLILCITAFVASELASEYTMESANQATNFRYQSTSIEDT